MHTRASKRAHTRNKQRTFSFVSLHTASPSQGWLKLPASTTCVVGVCTTTHSKELEQQHQHTETVRRWRCPQPLLAAFVTNQAQAGSSKMRQVKLLLLLPGMHGAEWLILCLRHHPPCLSLVIHSVTSSCCVCSADRPFAAGTVQLQHADTHINTPTLLCVHNKTHPPALVGPGPASHPDHHQTRPCRRHDRLRPCLQTLPLCRHLWEGACLYSVVCAEWRAEDWC